MATNILAMEWISVKDRLPENEKHVLITGNNTVYVGYYFYDSWTDLDGRTVSISHWQPLPEPPLTNSEK